jgi:trehalose-6-phosphate synthase
MPARDRAARMRSLRKRVRENDVASWSAKFLKTLRDTVAGRADAVPADSIGELEWTIDRRSKRGVSEGNG